MLLLKKDSNSQNKIIIINDINFTINVPYLYQEKKSINNKKDLRNLV